MIKSKSYEARLLEALRDPAEAAEYLTAALADGDKDVFLLALRHVAEAHGGIGRLSGRTRLNRVSLYRMLSSRGNPELRSLGALLESLGLRLAVEVRSGRAGKAAGSGRQSPRKAVRKTERAAARPG
jgi:probable addiction module antidote protein